ncbi:MAG: hypothetical protein V4548_00165 [Bacteroidota bacterium]
MDLINRKALILLTFLLSLSVRSQVKEKLGIGLYYGYRLNQGTLFFEYKVLKNHFILNGDLSIDKYQSFGIGFHSEYYPITKSTIKPFIGIGISRNVGRLYSYDRETDVVSIFSISDANYLTPSLGVRFEDVIKDKIRNKTISLFLKIGYKNNIMSNPNVRFVSGVEDNQKMIDIENYIKDGIVLSIGAIYCFK